MWMLLAMAAAGDLGRQDQPLKVTRYARLDGDGPVTGQWRNRSGAFLAWHFPDDQIEHVDVYDGKTLVSTRSFAADGRPETTVDWVTSSATVHLQPPVEVSIQDWGVLQLGDLTLRAPGALVSTDETTWAGAGLTVARQPAADPFTEAFRDEVQGTCACEVEARRTIWLGGRPGLLLRLERPGRTADLVAVPLGDALWILTSAGEGVTERARLRAMMATARESDP